MQTTDTDHRQSTQPNEHVVDPTKIVTFQVMPHTHTPQRRSQEFVTHKPQNWTDWLVRITRTRQEIACLIKTSKAASQQCLLANLLCETKAVTWRQRQERKAECGAGKKPVESTRAERTPKGFHTSIEEHLKNLRRCEDGLAKWMIPFTLSRTAWRNMLKGSRRLQKTVASY